MRSGANLRKAATREVGRVLGDVDSLMSWTRGFQRGSKHRHGLCTHSQKSDGTFVKVASGYQRGRKEG